MNDDLPERPKERLNILPLDALGVAELQGYIAELHAEIRRAELAVAHKQDHRSAAETVFGQRKGAG